MIQRLNDAAENVVDIQDGVVVRVVELLDGALIRDVGVMARWLEWLELGWVPVTVNWAMTAAAKMQDDEPVSGNVCL